MSRTRSLTWRLILWILGLGAAVMTAVFTINARETRALLEEMAKDRANLAAEAIANELEAAVSGVEQGLVALKVAVASPGLEKGHLHELIRGLVQSDTLVFGSTVAFEPGAFPGEKADYAPYYNRHGSGLTFVDIAAADPEFRSKPWYARPAATRAPTWSEPYVDEGVGEVRMVTHSVPITRLIRGRETLVAVATADIWLDILHRRIEAIEADLDNRDQVAVVSRDGALLVSREVPGVSVAEREAFLERPEIAGILDRMTGGLDRLESFTDADGTPMWISYLPMKRTGWSVAVMFREDHALADARRQEQRTWLALGAGLVLLALVVVVLSTRITAPLRLLAQATERIGQGEFDVPLPEVRGRDEVGALTTALRTMRADLQVYTRRLAEERETRGRLEGELDAARDIQMEMLPWTGMGYREEERYEIAATLVPAKAVGGDLYELFQVDEDTLCLFVGDVSGKGVPAALFMARTVTLIKLVTHEAREPARIMALLNEELCRDNHSCMFVTLFCGVLDLASGELACSSAGHNPPALIGADGSIELPRLRGGPPLGLMEGTEYQAQTVELGPGDALLVYTDGVTEAMDAREALYEEHRLVQALGEARDDPREQVNAVLGSVEAFAAGAEQADDITLLALRYGAARARHQPSEVNALIMATQTRELARARDWLDALLVVHGAGQETVSDLQIITDEVLSNVVHHAHPRSDDAAMELRVRFAGDGVELEFRDRGPAFNPLERIDPDLAVAVEEREEGGVGLLMLKRLADRVDYVRDAGCNVLRVTKRVG